MNGAQFRMLVMSGPPADLPAYGYGPRSFAWIERYRTGETYPEEPDATETTGKPCLETASALLPNANPTRRNLQQGKIMPPSPFLATSYRPKGRSLCVHE